VREREREREKKRRKFILGRKLKVRRRVTYEESRLLGSGAV
jgi:hypothetical protein